MAAINRDYIKERKQRDIEYNYKTRAHKAGKVFGYFFSTIVIIAGLFLFVGAMNETIFHGIFLLIMSLAVIVGARCY